MLNRIILLFSLSLLGFDGFCQTVETYLFPINPGSKNFLAGTMGELRSSHFHAGIDIKTGGQEGLSVLATKSGYISRIKVSTGGYGLALYMNHPDGNTSVYAHLRKFAPAIERYVKEAQYERKTYEIELFPTRDQFKFSRGEEIAKSGNTGGSTGPHLHFEIRDAAEEVLNPLHYGFTEIKDDIPPIVQDFRLRPKDQKSSINNQFRRTAVPLNRNGFNYQAQNTVFASGQIGMELLAHDKLNGAANKNGVSIIEVFVNDELYFKQDINKMSFATQRNILVHYPYDIKVKEGLTFHKLYVDDGNSLDFYFSKTNNGWLNIEQDSTYDIKIDMYDPYENKSTLKLLIKGTTPENVRSGNKSAQLDKIEYNIEHGMLQIFASADCIDNDNTELSLRLPDRIVGLEPSYFLQNTAVYLWNIADGMPQSVLSCNLGMEIVEQMVLPKTNTTVEGENFKAYFSTNSLFDTVFITTGYTLESRDSLEIFSIQPETFPLKSNIDITLQPLLNYQNKDKTSVYETNGRGYFSYEGGSWTGNSISFRTRSFGNYTLLEDSIAPTINRVNQTLFFTIRDKLSGIKTYDAYLNGEWVLLKYEPKKALLWVEWLNDVQEKKGVFELVVVDKAGNSNSLKFNL